MNFSHLSYLHALLIRFQRAPYEKSVSNVSEYGFMPVELERVLTRVTTFQALEALNEINDGTFPNVTHQ